MKNKIINEDKFQRDILELMIDSGLPEDNAYNWGLQHATLLLNGVKPETIVDMRMRMTMGQAL
jgi:hypothetical protein